MQKIKKFLAVALLLIALPIASFIATHLVLGSSRNIYDYIPETSDIIIEVNTRNFVREIMYQRIFKEDYFNEKIVVEEGEEPEFLPAGIDPFSSIVVFREQWAEENIWMALVGYEDRALFEAYIKEKLPESHYYFGSDYLLLQITPSGQQDVIDAHMQKIMNGEVKSFKTRFDLTELFDPSKEINCYMIPQHNNNKLLNGSLSFDFLKDNIKIEGKFTPVSGFSENPPIAYAVDETSALSIRSSLNIMHSIDWLIKEKGSALPDYSQFALDYYGMKMFMIDEDLGYPFAFKIFPEMQVHFDIVDHAKWRSMFDTLKNQKIIKVDTVAQTLVERHGVFFSYRLTDKEFELMRSEVNLQPFYENNTYFALQLKVAPMIDNTKFAVDEENPPLLDLQKYGLIAANGILEELLVMANIEDIRFELKLKDETNMIADGKIQMINREGNSMIESMNFGMAAVLFITSYLSNETVEE